MFLGVSWWFFVVLGNFLVVLGGSWCSWWFFVVIPDGSLWFLVVLGVLGGSLWFLVVLCSSWWFLVVLGGSW